MNRQVCNGENRYKMMIDVSKEETEDVRSEIYVCG